MWTRGTPAAQAAAAWLALETISGANPPPPGLHKFLQVRHHHLADELTVVSQPVLRGNENQLCRLQRFGHRDSDAVGVDPVRLAVAVEAEGRNDRNNALVQQGFEELGVDPFHLPGKQLVDAMNDPQRDAR